MENYLSDEAFSALDFRTVAAYAMTGFCIAKVEPAVGPDGTTLLFGNFPALGQQMYIFSIFYDEDDGIIYQRAMVPDGAV